MRHAYQKVKSKFNIMKKVNIVLTLALLLSTLAIAQREGRRGHHGGYHNDLTVEQLATLKTKKMTLALDLSEKQQQQIMELNLANTEFKKSKMEERKVKKESGEAKKPSAQERYAKENERLDRMIAQQEKLKKILSDEQYKVWKTMQVHRHAHRGKGKGMGKGKEGRRG